MRLPDEAALFVQVLPCEAVQRRIKGLVTAGIVGDPVFQRVDDAIELFQFPLPVDRPYAERAEAPVPFGERLNGRGAGRSSLPKRSRHFIRSRS